MMVFNRCRRILRGPKDFARSISEKANAIITGLDNHSRLLNDKSNAIIEGLDNQSRLLNDKSNAIIQGLDNQSRLLDDRFKQLVEGVINRSSLLNDKLMAIVARQDAQIELQRAETAAIRKLLFGRDASEAGSDLLTIQAPPVRDKDAHGSTALRQPPLMIDAKTYNTSHPDYDAARVRNFPGKILNFDKPCRNPVYVGLKQLAKGDAIPDEAWTSILSDALVEVKTIAHSDQVFERRAYIENYVKEIAEKYQADYHPGWVNLDDALFLYWLVRRLKPKTIVQTGVCNGLSSAFMMLGLVKNGPEGRMHAIDLPPVFDPRDAAWTVKGKVYDFFIPEGKSSGWMVPDSYRDRFDVWSGNAKKLLPKMVDKVDPIDLFYHDSNHTYDHMTFEFHEVKRKLRSGGLVVADNISWNASVWDFADEYGVPSYNFKGAVGAAFF